MPERHGTCAETSVTLRKRIFHYLQLMRFPNVFTAMADVLAGYLIISGTHIKWSDISCLLLSSASIYAGGCVLNDLCDKDLDAKERPSRPLPSGRVSAREAFILTCLLFMAGLLGALQVGLSSFYVASLLVILVISYDALTKKRGFIGPLNMGACRSVNLIFGMSPAPAFTNVYFLFPLISLFYVFSLTRLSRFEVTGGRQKGISFFAGWTAVILSVLYLRYGNLLANDSLVFLSIYTVLTGPVLLKSYLIPAPDAIRGAVKALILGIPLIDAVYVSGIQGWTYGIPVAFCVVPTVMLSRYFYVT
jgi:4-hydroxybenzoate polyprenyltransferase